MSKWQLARLNLLGVVVALAAVFSTQGVGASTRLCSAMCTEESSCYEGCYDIDATTCGEYGVCGNWDPIDYCGDGLCATSHENCDNCPSDCGECQSPTDVICGNNICEPGESSRSCLADCPKSNPVQCGDGLCEDGESWNSCEADCGYTDNCKTPHFINDDWLIGDELCRALFEGAIDEYHCASNRCTYAGVGGGGGVCWNEFQCNAGMKCIGWSGSTLGYCINLP
jgi:hypothetical protein